MNYNIHFAPPQEDFEQWFAAARRAVMGGYTRDAILGGLRARLYTNQLAAAETWSEMFFGPQEWQTLVQQAPPTQPAMCLYVAATEQQAPLTAISPAQSVGVIFNRMASDALLDVTAALAAHELGKQADWVVRGTCAAAGGRAIVVTGPGHAAIAAEIARQAGGQVVVDDPVLVRLMLTRRTDGARLAPTRILTEHGQEITGARILQWLRREAQREPLANVHCLKLNGCEESVAARDFDMDQCAEPYAYPLTRTSPRLTSPPLVTDAIALAEGSQAAVFSVDVKTFIARLRTNQPWTPPDVVYQAALTLDCHVAGAASPSDERLKLFIAEIARGLSAKKAKGSNP